jgi:phage gpG-like protein
MQNLESRKPRKMTEQSKATLLDSTDPITRYLADGGSWANAVEMEYEQNLIPKWSRQLQASLGKKSPSAEKHRQRLIDDLQMAYAYCGISGDHFQTILATLLTP